MMSMANTSDRRVDGDHQGRRGEKAGSRIWSWDPAPRRLLWGMGTSRQANLAQERRECQTAKNLLPRPRANPSDSGRGPTGSTHRAREVMHRGTDQAHDQARPIATHDLTAHHRYSSLLARQPGEVQRPGRAIDGKGKVRLG